MRNQTNTALVKRNKQIAQYLFLFSFAVLIAAFIFNFNFNPQTASSLELILPLLALPLGLIATLASVRMTNLWVREPRPENALRDGLKGLSNKSVLFNYYHLPARHVLICPQGVFAITTRYQDGTFTVKGDEWTTEGGAMSAFMRTFRRDGIGNPNQDALAAAAHVQKLLAPIAPGVTVKPLIVFTDPRAQLNVDNPAIPVLHASPKLKPNIIEFMRAYPKEAYDSLTVEQIEAFEAATVKG